MRRPLPAGDTLLSPVASPTRRAIERRSAAMFVFLHQLPRWVVAILAAVVFGVGLVGHGLVGAAALAVVLAFMTWLSYVSWPAIDSGGRRLRILVLCAIALAMVVKLVRG